MGYSSWSGDTYKTRTVSRATTPRAAVFTNTTLDATLDPKGVTREARDSEEHPESTPIIVAFDVTGSMGSVPHYFATEKLGTLMKMLVAKGWANDPQILMAAVGDAISDRVPLQVGQFEAGIEMDDDLTKIYIEGGGGGQCYESYALIHYFAARHTETDSYNKRGKKGYLFTIGDEGTWNLSKDDIKNIFGDDVQGEVTAQEAIEEAKEKYHVYHILTTNVGAGRNPKVRNQWDRLLGENVIYLQDHKMICETIGTQIALGEGLLDMDDVDKELKDFGLTSSDIKTLSKALVPVSRAVKAGALAAVANGSLAVTSSTGKSEIERL